ncbi:MAG TPA: ion channel [Thermoanaerobaculia bacterium]|nr:ion channel [Thermoanaerobaculia bacterium]
MTALEPTRAERRASDGAQADANPDPNADLGFGAVVARESRQRLLNRDGTFNVRRVGLRVTQSLSIYHYLLTITWTKFLLFLGSGYLLANAVFAVVYVACGPDALSGNRHFDVPHRFGEAFFFSVHTLATIGYGNVAPLTVAANLVVTIESLVGLISFAVVAGIVYARVARPVARILFSDHAVVAPYRGGRALMFRIVNQRSSQLVDLEAKLLLARRRKSRPNGDREFLNLALERDRVAFFPLSWTIVHPITQDSPLWEYDEQDMRECDTEFLILLNGFDETFSQTVHARSSYRGDEIVWNARFANMFNPPDEEGVLTVDVRKLHELDHV